MSAPESARREALAAFAIAPVIAAAPAVALAKGVDRSAWNAAVAAYEKADADADKAIARWDRARDTYIALTGREPGHEPHDEATARLCGFTQLNSTIDEWGDRVGDAVERVLQLPAPDNEALLWKLEYLFGKELDDGGASTACWSAEAFAPTMADLRRLLTVGRA
jgi:hypothetical protein